MAGTLALYSRIPDFDSELLTYCWYHCAHAFNAIPGRNVCQPPCGTTEPNNGDPVIQEVDGYGMVNSTKSVHVLTLTTGELLVGLANYMHSAWV